MQNYQNYISEVDTALKELAVTTASGETLSADQGFSAWVDWTKEIKNSGQNIYFIGNGASAAMASHMSADATKNGKLRALAFNDISLMTAASNDISYEDVFSFPLSMYGRKNDMLITISSSGNSPNVVKAIGMAKELGIKVVTLSGRNKDNCSRKLGDLNFYIPNNRYGVVECSHQTLLHAWLDRYLDVHEGGAI